jgi:hypothetical protein
MVRRLLFAVALTFACSSKREPAQKAPPPVQQDQPFADGHLNFIPDGIAARVGHHKMLAAIDLRAFKEKPFLRLIPEKLACARDLIQYAGVFVMVADEGSQPVVYATQLSELGTKQCIEASGVGHARIAADGTLEVGDAALGASLRWDGGVLTVQALGTPVTPPVPADATLMELVHRVPPQAPAFLVGHDLGKIETLVVWGQADAQALTITVHAETGSPEDAAAIEHDFIAGVNEAAQQRRYTFDPAWFKTSVTGNLVTVDGRIPLSAFARK